MFEDIFFFFTAGLIIILGFFSMLFFDRTKIPDILILMTAGILINQGLGFVDSSIFMVAAPYIGALALMMILFEGGINLKFHRVLKELPKASGFTFAVFILSVLIVAIVVNLFFGRPIVEALLFATVLGGTSSAIVIALVSRLPVNDCLKILLTLESTLTDALCIITTIALSGIVVLGYLDTKEIANTLFSSFSIASVVALIVGIAWIKIMSRFHQLPFGYLLTVAVIFMLYSTVEYADGNGAIAAFVFGLVLGNSREIGRALKMSGDFVFTERIKSFHEEVSFFIRTFFFVYLGLLFNPQLINGQVIVMSSVVVIASIGARFIPTFFVSRNNPDMEGSGTLVGTMMPRGLAAAVLATMPDINAIMPDDFIGIVITVIIFTNVIATVGAYLFEKNRRRDLKEKKQEQATYELLKTPDQDSCTVITPPSIMDPSKQPHGDQPVKPPIQHPPNMQPPTQPPLMQQGKP